MKNLSAIVLAAGKGTRMKSRVPKVLHPLLGKPILVYVLDMLKEFRINNLVVVLGHGGEKVGEFLKNYNVTTVIQNEQKGTAHAVMCASTVLSGIKEDVLIMCGDTPLFKKDTMEAFLKRHQRSGRKLSILSSYFQEPHGYGRIVRDIGDDSKVVGIVEEKDASEAQREIREVNTGIYAVDASFLFESLESIDTDNVQGEYYLTDIVRVAHNRGIEVGALCLADEDEALGVNSRVDLSQAEGIMLERLRKRWMEMGVTFHLPNSSYLDFDVKLNRDVVVGSHCVIMGNTIVGEGAEIGAFSFLKDVLIAPGTKIPPYSYINKENQTLGKRIS